VLLELNKSPLAFTCHFDDTTVGSSAAHTFHTVVVSAKKNHDGWVGKTTVQREISSSQWLHIYLPVCVCFALMYYAFCFCVVGVCVGAYYEMRLHLCDDERTLSSYQTTKRKRWCKRTLLCFYLYDSLELWYDDDDESWTVEVYIPEFKDKPMGCMCVWCPY